MMNEKTEAAKKLLDSLANANERAEREGWIDDSELETYMAKPER